MVNLTQINCMICDLEKEIIPQSIESTVIHNEKLDTLYWYKNCDQLRTQEEVQNKIKRLQEECLLLDPTDLFYKAKQQRIDLLKSLF